MELLKLFFSDLHVFGLSLSLYFFFSKKKIISIFFSPIKDLLNADSLPYELIYNFFPCNGAPREYTTSGYEN